MSEPPFLDRALDDVFAGSPQVAPRLVVDRAIAAALEERQQRARVPLLDGRTWPPRHSIADPELRRATRLLFVAAAVMLAALAAVAALVGTSAPPPLGGVLAIVRDGEVAFASADGTSPRVVLDGVDFREAVWSPDGRYLAVVATDANTAEPRMVVIDAQGRTVGAFKLPYNGYDPSPVWAPDGEHLLVDRGGGALGVVGIDGTVAWSSTAPTAGDRMWRAARSAAWRPDGAWIAVDIRREANLCHETILVPTTGDHAASLFRDGDASLDCSPHRPAWSPDGRRLAMLRSGPDCWPWQELSPCDLDLVIYDDTETNSGLPLEGVEPRLVARRLSVGTRPLWMPSGDEILVARRLGLGRRAEAELVLVRADGSGERTIGTIPTGHLSVDWAVPGRSIIYRVGRDDLDGNGPDEDVPGEIRLRDLTTSEDRRLADQAYRAALQPSAGD